MKLEDAIQSYEAILANGPLGTRLKFDYGLEVSYRLTDSEQGRMALNNLYLGDIEVAQEYQLPIILNAATFRTSKNHLRQAGLTEHNDFIEINKNNINFIKNLKSNATGLSIPIFISAPIGSMYDAYSTTNIPSINEAYAYHQEQIILFDEMGVDLINAVTLPSLNEALGIALAAQKTNIPYTIGFILNKNNTLLDGTCLENAIQVIDNQVTRKPLGYLITCTHTSVIENLTNSPTKFSRLIGIQPNGSDLEPKQLATMEKPISDSPEMFATKVAALKNSLNLKIVAGCCGTNKEHLKHIAQTLSPLSKQPKCKM